MTIGKNAIQKADLIHLNLLYFPIYHMEGNSTKFILTELISMICSFIEKK